MKKSHTHMLLALLLAALLGLGASLALAEGGYTLTWLTVDGGGGASAGGGYALASTSGQADAGALGGGGYALSGGFWGGAAATATPTSTPATPTSTPEPGRTVYLPLVAR